MKAFITGGSGFVGGAVVRQLLDRGDQVIALARSDRSARALEDLGAQVARGDITDRDSLAAGMEGCDVVFHIAAWYEVGVEDKDRMYRINVDGTRNVLEKAVELAVPRIVYTSTLAVNGDTQGRLVDETYTYQGPFTNYYDETKWQAHYEVALPMIEAGAPIVIVMPGGTYGPGDPNVTGELMRTFYRGDLFFTSGPETILTYAHVEDIARGHILAATEGQPGETYILAGPAVPLGDMIKLWSQLTGRPAPLISIPARFLRPLAPIVGLVQSFVPLPEMFRAETVQSLGSTYMGTPEKARRELDWTPRPLIEGLQETFAWLDRHVDAPDPEEIRNRQRALIALGGILLLLFLRRLSRRR